MSQDLLHHSGTCIGLNTQAGEMGSGCLPARLAQSFYELIHFLGSYTKSPAQPVVIVVHGYILLIATGFQELPGVPLLLSPAARLATILHEA